ncbi:MAG TPA: type II toxin-antitoxin system VapC family toxin [Candidatus Limnocylindria bacterium]|nr:type II toxin-antitoxin system VapC family toxin [Candidatus Limnocylindria bacterium]
MKFVLDTSAWLRAYLEPETIPLPELNLLRAKGEIFGLSAISLWEVGKKHQLGKLPLPRPLRDWLLHAMGDNVELLPLTPEVIADAMALPDFPNRDPGDEIVVATARVHRLTLLTTDTQLKKYRHARIHYFTPVLKK